MQISESRRLLLLAALDGPDNAAAHFAAWSRLVDLNDVIGPEFRLLPLVHRNIATRLPDDALKARLRGIARHSWMRNRLRLQVCLTIIDQLIAMAIPFVLMKGTALMLLLGEAAEVRVMADCDLLVPNDHIAAAVALLREAGLVCPYLAADRLDASDLHLLHGVGFVQPDSRVGLIDLHWRPLMEVKANEFTQDFVVGSVPADFSGRSLRIPATEALFLQTIVHGTKWADPMRFDWLADCVLMLRRTGAAFDWRSLWRLAERYGLAAILADGLELLACTVPLPIGPEIWRQQVGRLPSYLEHREARLRQNHPATLSPSDWLVMDLCHLRRADGAHSALPMDVATLQRRQRAPQPGPEIVGGFDDGAATPLLFVSGWSHPETQGRWTDGSLATLAVRKPPQGASQRLILSSVAYTRADSFPQRADVFVGGQFITRLVWPAGRSTRTSHEINLAQIGTPGEFVMLQFRIAKPGMPGRTLPGGDIRRLGFFLLGTPGWAPGRHLEDGAIELGGGGLDRGLLGDGWDISDAGGVWTMGTSAALSWDSTQPADRQLAATITACAADHVVGFAYINDALVGAFAFANKPVMPRTTLLLQVPAQPPGRTTLRFETGQTGRGFLLSQVALA